jgi:hypothetical protein
MMSDFRLKCFSEYVLRTPLFPLSYYLKLIKNYSSEKAIQLYNNDSVVREAINLASPELRTELDKWAIELSSLSYEKKKALEFTFLKYTARISSRCTPFGLFSGCSVGNLSPQTNITLDSLDNHTRVTQFDMQYWVAMLQDIAKKNEVIVHLKFFPNSSIYEIGDFYRYVEYKYVQTKREYNISALRASNLLKEILVHAKSGITIAKMISMLADDESEKDQAQEFIFQLIKFQFLISELEAVVTGNDEWKRLVNIFDTIPVLNKEVKLFEKLKVHLSDLDSNLIPCTDIYERIKVTLKEIGTAYDEKYLFQTDLNISTLKNNLSTTVSLKTLKALQFLNGIQTKKESHNLENFKKAFIRRYESKEMPLITVLDPEIGIGYVQDHDMNDSHDILEKFSFTDKQVKDKKQVWTTFDFILQNKLHDSLFNNEKSIVLSEKDFPDFDNSFKNTPITFSVMIEVYTGEKIALTSSGNVSASKLLGRFCHANNAIDNLTKKIVQKENEYYPNKILAEIVHIPESRTGNILRRPTLRKHEIAYLCKTGVPKENNLNLDDLFISVQGNEIILRSEKHSKEVMPCMSSAHNFTKNSLPIYHFLCDLELQNQKPIFTFNWGVLETHYNFFPRVIYDDVILSKAKWIIKNEEIIHFYKMNTNILTEEFPKFKRNRKIPQYVNWVNFDNTLLLNLETKIGINLFLKSVKNQEKIILEEFLFIEKSIIQNTMNNDFCNQIILSYYKERL